MADPSKLSSTLLYGFADSALVRKRQRATLKLFSDLPAGKVLDLGCGRGIFLDLLREAGLEAAGVDGSPDSVAECRRLGFTDVVEGDVLAFLRSKSEAGTRYAGVLCSHLIEHFAGDQAVELVELSARVIAPGGRLVIVTPNVRNLFVWQNVFWLDPTHVRPYPRPLIEALMKASGLEVLKSFDDPGTRGDFVWRLVRYGMSALEGQDSVVVGRRKT